MVMVLLLFAYYLTFTTNLSADVYGIYAMHGYKPVELFLLASLPVQPEEMIWSMVGSGIQKSIISFLRSFFQMGQAV